MSAEEQFQRRLQELFRELGWRTRSSTQEEAADFFAETNAQRYAVQVKFANEARRPLLEGLIASAILRSRAAAIAANARPLAVVCAPSISNNLLTELGDFVDRFGEGAAWGAMDNSGFVALYGTGLEAVRRQRQRLRKAPAHRSDFFSDLGQWMLKVLLSHQLPPELRLESPVDRAPIDEPIASVIALSRIAGVSQPSASRLVAALKEEEFLIEDQAPLHVIRVDELLDRWSAVFKRRPLEIRARWLFPPRDPVKQLDDRLKRARGQGRRASLGLFAACDRLGFRFVSGVAPHLYLERVSNELPQRFGLRPAEPGEAADVIVREPRFPESVFRGTLDRNGVPTTDVLQCWLDVANNPARGEEMAAHVYERVIRPRLVEPDR